MRKISLKVSFFWFKNIILLWCDFYTVHDTEPLDTKTNEKWTQISSLSTRI